MLCCGALMVIKAFAAAGDAVRDYDQIVVQSSNNCNGLGRHHVRADQFESTQQHLCCGSEGSLSVPEVNVPVTS